ELALAFHEGGFGSKDLAPDFRPRQAYRGADLVLFLRLKIAEAHRTEHVGQGFRRDHHLGLFLLARARALVVHHVPRDLAAEVADLALEVPDAGFPGVTLRQRRQTFV